MSDENGGKVVSLSSHKQKIIEENEPYIRVFTDEGEELGKIDMAYIEALSKGDIDIGTDDMAKLVLRYMMVSFIEGLFYSESDE